MNRIIYILLFLLFSNVLKAQEILSHEEKEAELITRFPIRMFNGGVIVIKACFDNIPDSLNFILDTGSGGISLDSATCTEFDIISKPTDTTITGIGGKKKAPFVFDKTLHLPGLDIRHLNFHVNDYSVLTSVYGEKVDGIIGYSFFSRYIIKLDFDNLLLEVYSPGRIDYGGTGTLIHPVFTSLPIQYLQIKDRKKMGYNFYFDTGAGLCFLMSEQFARDSAVLLKKRKPLVTQAEGMAGRLEMRLTVVKDVKIGPYHFRAVPTYLYQDDNNVTSYPYVGGLIGNELLRRFNLTLNYQKREIFLSPNSHYYDQFDYSYTGLGIYYVEGRIMVVDVIDGSPAEKCGFKPGDEVFAVENNLSHNIQQYKTLLQVPNQHVRVIIKRDNQIKELILKTKSIF